MLNEDEWEGGTDQTRQDALYPQLASTCAWEDELSRILCKAMYSSSDYHSILVVLLCHIVINSFNSVNRSWWQPQNISSKRCSTKSIAHLTWRTGSSTKWFTPRNKMNSGTSACILYMQLAPLQSVNHAWTRDWCKPVYICIGHLIWTTFLSFVKEWRSGRNGEVGMVWGGDV